MVLIKSTTIGMLKWESYFCRMEHPNLLWPYQNKSLIDMPGELWKDIPGFEGYFQASNMGRIKSLDRVIPHPRLNSQFVKGQILTQSASKNNNIKTGEPMIDLRTTLTVESKPNYFNTRRLIYMTFVNPRLDHKKDKLYIINLDGNGYDNRPENLKAVTHSEKQTRAIQRDRVMPSLLKTADRTHWKKNNSRNKPIEQLDLDGNQIRRYSSIREASRESGIANKAIIDVPKASTSSGTVVFGSIFQADKIVPLILYLVKRFRLLT